MKRIVKLVFMMSMILSALFFLSSCDGINQNCGFPALIPPVSSICSEDIDSVKLDVKYVAQGFKPWCLAASGTMVLNYYGVNVSLDEVANAIGCNDDNCGPISNILDYAKKLGFKTDEGCLTLANLKCYLQQGIPVILDATNHADVVIGYDDKAPVPGHPDKQGCFISVGYNATYHPYVQWSNFSYGYCECFENWSEYCHVIYK